MSGVEDLAHQIQRIARRALELLPRGDNAHRVARSAVIRPIDYMRWAEFDSVLRRLVLKPGERVLDIASPQWFTLALADANPQTEFVYTNILEAEIAPFRRIAEVVGIANVQFKIEDVRSLSFEDAAFDHILSISVIEHVFPEIGGDYDALRELRRVLADDGQLHLTTPLKEQRNVVYVYGRVYERAGRAKQFFAREYDRLQFTALIEASGFTVDGSADMICERPGLFALDTYTWGPRSNALTRAAVTAGSLFAERLLGRSFEASLARRYLSASPTPSGRLVNVGVTLKKLATT
jgi:SAM-dependent methyltransferase